MKTIVSSDISLQVGGIYSILDGEKSFSAAKLIAHEDGICHVRIYKQKFAARPTDLDISSLSLGRLGEPGGFGIGHVPMREQAFQQWHPILIATSDVTSDESEAYTTWKEVGGGVF
jgi:hypothetical protein